MGDVENLANLQSSSDPSIEWSFGTKASRSLIKPDIKIYNPAETALLLPGHAKEMFLFESRHKDFVMHISTHGRPNAGEFNCGGLRIVPEAMVTSDYRNDVAALRLGAEMDAKGDYARIARVAGHLVKENFEKIQFGKHVVLPPKGARVGESRDGELMEFIVASLSAFKDRLGIDVITGQDLGHGKLSFANNTSLGFLSGQFNGCLNLDTSLPTAVGNFMVVKGLLEGNGLKIRDARIGLIGFGNIGSKVVEFLKRAGARNISVCESSPARQDAALFECDGNVWASSDKLDFLKESFDILVFNSNGGSLDADAVDAICKSNTIKAVTGCENMIWANGINLEHLLVAKGIVMPPTSFTGMGGWLAAAEAVLAKKMGRDFDLEQLFDPLSRLSEVAAKVAVASKNGSSNQLFGKVLFDLYGNAAE
jgi:hypothetical protein